MKPRQFTRRSPRKCSAGFTLIEMLLTMSIASVILAMMSSFFRANAELQNDMSARTEAQLERSLMDDFVKPAAEHQR